MGLRIPNEEWVGIAMRCEAAPDSEKLFGLLCEVRRRLGAVSVAYIHFPPFGTHPRRDPLTIWYEGIDDAFAEAYARDRLWRHSPTVREALRTGAAFVAGSSIADSFDEETARARPSAVETARRIDDLRTGHDVIAFGAFGPQGRMGYYAYWLPKSETPLSPEEMMILRNIGQLSHVRYCQLRGRDGYGEAVDLTARESRAVSLSAAGRTQRQIADEMGLKATTVRSTLRTAGVKLGTDKEDARKAILKAVALGQLDRVGAELDAVMFRTPAGRRTARLPRVAA